MDDVTGKIRSAFFVAEESAMSRFQALHEVERELFRSLYAGSHDFHAFEAGGKVDKDNSIQVGRALRLLGHVLGHVSAYSPEARGRRMFGTLQKRLPQELRLVTGMANRFLKQVYLPDQQFPPEGATFMPFADALDDILCVHELYVHEDASFRTTTRCSTVQGAQPADPQHRRHYVRAEVRVHERHALAVFHGPRRLAHYRADGSPRCNPEGRVTRFNCRMPVGTAASRLTISPQAQPPQRKRLIDFRPSGMVPVT